MPFQFSIPTTEGPRDIHFEAGETVIFVGANGGGKTRLSVHIENALGFDAHRISAHRALSLNSDVTKISEEKALSGLRVGNSDKQFAGNAQMRSQLRYGKGKQATALVNDFDFVIQALFAEQTNKVLNNRSAIRDGLQEASTILDATKFDTLCETWQDLLPHRKLVVTGDSIQVTALAGEQNYSAADMSDGERAIFYMIGQALLAKTNSVLVVDEPELHVHPSIMSKLWDAIEAARPDCSLVFITHDLHFAASRAAQKFVLRGYTAAPTWDIEPVPEQTGFSEELTTLILGSRKPILFVEGTEDSLDFAMYRARYTDWTVVPRSSCTEVIHSVVTMRKNEDLTRVRCTGIVDGDDYQDEDKAALEDLGIKVLSVAEIENLLLLPNVSSAIAQAEGFAGAELTEKLNALAEAIYQTLDTDPKIEAVVVRYCQRRIDRMLKKIDLSAAKTVEDLKGEFTARTGALDIESIAVKRTAEIEKALSEKDLPKLLAYYDNKGLIPIAATHLKGCHKDRFEGWISRSLQNGSCPQLTEALSNHLPEIEAR
ncbi:AAA family ATPase [Tateyamaria sp.]|uniref:AAA family ATPase n=1 Tax=Tateyamaria sp. TaxID=1929288 RepID=UPI00329B1F80